MGATQTFFAQQGLPAVLAWLAVTLEALVALVTLEALVALGLVLGLWVPLLCLISLPILLASMWIYRNNGFYFSGGGIELPILWAGAQIAQIMLGAGAFRLPLPPWPVH